MMNRSPKNTSNLILSYREHGSGLPTTTLMLPIRLISRSLPVAGFFPSLMARYGLLVHVRGLCDSCDLALIT